MHQTSANRLKNFYHHQLPSHQSKPFSFSSSSPPSEVVQKQNKADSKLNPFFEESINTFRKPLKYFESTSIYNKVRNLKKNTNSESSAKKNPKASNLNDKFHKKNLTLEIIKKNFDELSSEKKLKINIDQTESTKFFRSETEGSPKPHKKNGFSSITLLNAESVKNLNTLGSPTDSLNFRLRSYTAEYKDDYNLNRQSKINKKQSYDQYSQEFKQNNFKKDGSLIFEGQIENSKFAENEINEYEGTKVSFEKIKKKKALKLFEKKVII